MSSHNRARCISADFSTASARSNRPQIARETTFTDPVNAYLENHPPGQEEVLVELQGKGLGEGLQKVDCFASTSGKTFLTIVSAWNSNVSTAFDNAIPKKTELMRSNFNNERLAKCLLNLYKVMAQIDEAINDPNESIVLRTTAQQELWKFAFTDGIASWISLAKTLAINAAASKASLLFVNLDARHLNRKYKEDGFVWTDDPYERACVVCSHTFVDMPNNCKDVPERNRINIANQQTELAEWQKKKDCGEKNLGPKPKPAKQFTRVMHCHCGQFHCGGNTNVSIRQCPIMCIDSVTAQRYEIVDGVCQCPICICDCRRAVKVRLLLLLF